MAVNDFSELYPSEQEWEALAAVLLSPLHNLPGKMMQIQTFLPSTMFQQPETLRVSGLRRCELNLHNIIANLARLRSKRCVW